jgi:hypothetical protein
MREIVRRASALQVGDDIETSGGVVWNNISAIRRSGAELTFSFQSGDIVRRRPDDLVPVRILGSRAPEVKVGTLVKAKWSCTETLCPACKPDEIGVCYAIDRGSEYGYFFIFQRGGYGGFSRVNVEEDYLWLTDETCPEVASYQFKNDDVLEHDYKCGVFTPAFEMGR